MSSSERVSSVQVSLADVTYSGENCSQHCIPLAFVHPHPEVMKCLTTSSCSRSSGEHSVVTMSGVWLCKRWMASLMLVSVPTVSSSSLVSTSVKLAPTSVSPCSPSSSAQCGFC